MAQNHARGACATRPPRRLKNAQMAQATKGSTSSEWLGPRCQVMRSTGSLVSIGLMVRRVMLPDAPVAYRVLPDRL